MYGSAAFTIIIPHIVRYVKTCFYFCKKIKGGKPKLAAQKEEELNQVLQDLHCAVDFCPNCPLIVADKVSDARYGFVLHKTPSQDVFCEVVEICGVDQLRHIVCPSNSLNSALHAIWIRVKFGQCVQQDTDDLEPVVGKHSVCHTPSSLLHVFAPQMPSAPKPLARW